MSDKKTSERIREWIDMIWDEGRDQFVFMDTMRKFSEMSDADYIGNEKKIEDTIIEYLESHSRPYDEKKEAALDSFCGEGGDMSRDMDCSNCPLITDDNILGSLYDGGCLDWRDDLVAKKRLFVLAWSSLCATRKRAIETNSLLLST